MTIDFYQVWHNHDLENDKSLIAPLAKYLALEHTPVRGNSSGMDIQEYRIWLMPDEKFQSPSTHIGFASARWSEKFPGAPNVNWMISSNLASPMPGRVFQSWITASGSWMDHTSHFHRGMLKYIIEGAVQIGLPVGALNIPCLPMCNSFITNKEVFFEIKQKMEFLHEYYEKQYGHKFEFADNGYGDRVLGCFYERVLMISAASVPNLSWTNPVTFWQW